MSVVRGPWSVAQIVQVVETVQTVQIVEAVEIVEIVRDVIRYLSTLYAKDRPETPFSLTSDF